MQKTYLSGEENAKPEYKAIKLDQQTAEVGRLLISFMHYYGVMQTQITCSESKQREFLIQTSKVMINQKKNQTLMKTYIFKRIMEVSRF